MFCSRWMTVAAVVGTVPLVAPVAWAQSITVKSPQERAADAAILAALDRPIALNFLELPMSDCAAVLQSMLKVPVSLDTKVLTDVGVTTDRPVTFSSVGVTGRAALSKMLREMDLTWVIEDQTLMITTNDEAFKILELRVYPVRDLILPTGGQQPPDFDSLIDLIYSTVKPTSWDNVGGAGSIKGYDPTMSLVISQTREVHEQLEMLLAKMRAAGSLQRIRPYVNQQAVDRDVETVSVAPVAPRYQPVAAQPGWCMPRLHQ